VLKRVYDLKSEIQLFLEVKGKPFLTWSCGFAFCTDITELMNELYHLIKECLTK